MAGLLSDLINARNQRLGLLRAPIDANAVQGLLDASPVGSVGAPGGVLPNPNVASNRDPITEGLALSSFVPGIGDMAGLAADARTFWNDPSSRTPGNFALSLAGMAPFIPAMTVYHGSPHKFDAFDLSKIGTGEGAQAYGHGLYFAENPGVAKGYADRLGTPSANQVFLDGKLIATIEADHLRSPNKKVVEGAINRAVETLTQAGVDQSTAERLVSIANNTQAGGVDDAIARLELVSKYATDPSASQADIEFLKNLQNSNIQFGYRPPASNFYTVDLPDDAIEKMLDWDAPLSEQPEAVRAILPREWWESVAEEINVPVDELTGGQFYTRNYHSNVLAGPKRMPQRDSEWLMKLGIPGIKYYDGGSRGAGQGTRNFVVFDDKLPKILKRE